MVATEKKTPSRAGKPLLPPDEQFWQRYSPHYELPLAGATSFFFHGLVVGILAVGGLAFLFRIDVDAAKPPPMDMILVEGGGFGGPGGEPGLPGAPGEPGLKEMGLPDAGGSEGDSDASKEGVEELPSLPTMELQAPPSDEGTEPSNDVTEKLKQLSIDAEKRANAPIPKKAIGRSKGILGAKRPGGSTGKLGKGGQGGGPRGFGPKATDQEIKAWRWRFDLTGSPRDHADKLDRTGLIVAVPDPAAGKPDPKKGQHLFIRDLKRRPVMLEKGDFTKYEEAVKWYNRTPESVRGLVKELQLPFVPEYVVLLLPKDREAKMAAEEHRFAQQHGMNPAAVQETWFDFRLQNGVYEPIAIRQK
jgi:hypothetical protein